MDGFTQILRPYRGDKIAIYGLGVLTEELLPLAEQECGVVGLLDSFRINGTLYGKPIISLEEAVQKGAVLILVAARPESCKVIAKRIGAFCRAHQIALLDNRGKDLLEQRRREYVFRGIDLSSKDQLIEEISRHDAVSADMFDTVVMRRTLFPTDVFELVDYRLRQCGIVIEEFPMRRLAAEKELYRQTVPTLTEIYSHLVNTYGRTSISPEELAEAEWSVDSDLLVPRQEVCDLLQTVYQQNKPVYIVTDTFYTKLQLQRLLDRCGFTSYTEIISSCEYRTSKPQNLFRHLREKLRGRNCIHIGDSLDADVLPAEANGITGWRIYSGLDLFEHLGYLGTWDALDQLSSRVQAGMFVANLFNTPFQAIQKKVAVHCAYDIAYLFFAPLITGFVFWFDQQVHQEKFQNVLFSARDGYLIQKLYEQLHGAAFSTYFLTSRTAAIRAGIREEKDIRYIEEMRFSGTMREQMKKRFGVDIPVQNEPEDIQGLLACEKEILRKALVNRENYLTYIKHLKLKKGKTAFFDFVARGTVQMYLGRLMENPITGFYFMEQDGDYMQEKCLDICSYYTKDESVHSALSENYYILETVLTSPDPSLIGFDCQGVPLYEKETRTADDLRCVQEMQDGICDYFQTYLKLYPKGPENKALGEMLLPLVHGVEIKDETFLALKVEDPFFNRTSSLLDLL